MLVPPDDVFFRSLWKPVWDVPDLRVRHFPQSTRYASPVGRLWRSRLSLTGLANCAAARHRVKGQGIRVQWYKGEG